MDNQTTQAGVAIESAPLLAGEWIEMAEYWEGRIGPETLNAAMDDGYYKRPEDNPLWQRVRRAERWAAACRAQANADNERRQEPPERKP